MKYRITIEGDDLKEDIDGFVADLEHNGTVQSGEDGDGFVIIVDKVHLLTSP